MKIDILYSTFLKYPKICIDSRAVEKNALFFALKGENFDGNRYAHNALENGCVMAVVDNAKYVKGENYFLVDNVLETLQELGNYHRRILNIPVIAITGTNGKTTTKELTASVLSSEFNVTYTKGNLNNHIGVPLTLLSMDENTQIGIVEMGANHLNEIETLCKIAEPDYGIITNIGRAHLEGFGSYNNVINAKKELYDYIKQKDEIVFYNNNNELLRKITEELDIKSIPFGGENSEVRGEVLDSNKFFKLKIHIGDYITVLETQLTGNYNMENVLAAATIGYYNNIKPEIIVNAIKKYKPENNRSQFLKTKKNSIYLDAYNANPSSVKASVDNFLSLNISNKSIILGDMLELGNDSVDEHKKIIKMLKVESINRVILVGSIYYTLDIPDGFLKFMDVDTLKDWLEQNEIENSNILIKGSRGVSLEKIIELL